MRAKGARVLVAKFISMPSFETALHGARGARGVGGSVQS